MCYAAVMLRQVIPGIRSWPWFAERFGYDFNGWLVEHPDGNLVIDPVLMTDEVLLALEQAGVARILITNRNHYRDAARLRGATSARVAVHPADAAFVRDKGVIVDDALEPGGTVGPFGIVGVPGKSPGEVALYWRERRIVLVGDACVGPKPGQLGLLPQAVTDDPQALRASLGRLADTVDFDVLLLGDGHSILEGGRAKLRALVATFTR